MNGRRSLASYSWRATISDPVDVVMLYASPEEAWWIIPAAFVRELGKVRLATTLRRSPGGKPSQGLERWLERWDVFQRR